MANRRKHLTTPEFSKPTITDRPTDVESEEARVVAEEEAAARGPDPWGEPTPRGEGHTVPQPVGVTMRKKAAAIKRERAAFHRQAADYIPASGPSEKRLAHNVVALILDEFALIDERMDSEK